MQIIKRRGYIAKLCSNEVVEIVLRYTGAYALLLVCYALIFCNAPSLLFCGNVIFSCLSRLLALAREYNVVLCHENEAKIFGDIPERVRLLLDHFEGELKCVFDMGNYVLENVDPCAAYELLKEDIAYFHIKDALYAGAIVPPGCGEAKIKEILSLHREYAKDDFFVSLEPHLECFSGLNALVGRTFENPYKYENEKAAFTDAVEKFKELIKA